MAAARASGKAEMLVASGTGSKWLGDWEHEDAAGSSTNHGTAGIENGSYHRLPSSIRGRPVDACSRRDASVERSPWHTARNWHPTTAPEQRWRFSQDPESTSGRRRVRAAEAEERESVNSERHRQPWDRCSVAAFLVPALPRRAAERARVRQEHL